MIKLTQNHYCKQSKESDDDQQENEPEKADSNFDDEECSEPETDHHQNAPVVKKLTATSETLKEGQLNKMKAKDAN